ncbi:facilitated trehalose transporter Tret1-2 homolog [Homarus americanus]|uniref:Facilitated trehalose transporter Tret1-2-like 8 n=1 Tax=Homarus americanus TaxID=6706 RepID=A0A8J5MSP0_HOMAM|nr:facilitated trehalose transporter Tret1-2 homolog [Homarus americanus]KAG7161961.1 Facilitated trehalose transporter Tret1-2-like 8 [Homarus americanus]
MKYDLQEEARTMSPLASKETYFDHKDNTDGSLVNTTQTLRNTNVVSECLDILRDPPEGHSQQNLVSDLTKPTVATQLFAALVVALVQTNVSIIMGFSGVTLPQLTNQHSEDLILNSTEAALFGSLASLGSGIGCLVSRPLLVRLGHRLTLTVTLPITVSSWLALSFSPNVWVLLTARVLLGVTTGFMLTSGGPYILEIAHKNIRGRLFGITILVRQMWFFFVAALGSSALDWRQMGFVSCGVSAIPFPALFLLPNSPRWLVTQGQVTEAQKALIFFRGKHYDSEPELKAITEQVENSSKLNNSFWQQLQLIFEPSTLAMFCLLAFLSLLTSFNGNIVMVTYLVPIFEAAKTDVDAYTCAMIFSAVKVIGSLLLLCVVDHLGRKPLIIVSYSLGTVCMAVYGGYFYMLTTGSASNMSWLPLTAAVIYVFCISAGHPVFPVLRGELIPTSCRSLTYSVITSLVQLGLFLSTQFYPMTVEALGEHGAFWFFSGVCATVTIVSAVALPETRGRSLEEIT